MSQVEVIKGPPPLSPEEVRRRIRDYAAGAGVTRAIVFGSFARGDADVASDVDVILIEPTSRPFLERGLAHLPCSAWAWALTCWSTRPRSTRG